VKLRNRIIELRHVLASELAANPRNWRTHPESQRQAVQDFLEDVGFADALLARKTEDGFLELIDGHLRADLMSQQSVPVLVLDVSRDEADKLLAVLDPLTQMADFDCVKLDALLSAYEKRGQAIGELCRELADKAGLHQEHREAGDSKTEEVDVDAFQMTHRCKECGFEFNA
jgi:ParB-like chromosome segregation protein Spo0J